jgi:hypothetical protein
MRELSYVEICLTDNAMDASGTLAKPLNSRVQKCPVHEAQTADSPSS